MSISPVKFATAFERLRTQLGAIQSESARLQLLMTFWPEIKAVRGNQTFSGFVEEYNGLLAKALTAAAITDLDADGLAQLESQIADLTAVEIGADKMAAVKMGRARLLLYLGETEAGVAAAAEAANVKYEPAEQSAAGRHRSEFERFEQAYNALPETELKRQLQPILEDWQARREAVHHDRAVCVFVAKGASDDNSDGRMRILRAQIEPASKAAPGDQVTFDNQIRTPQDPFVGSAYAALAAVRGYLAESGYSGRAKSHLNAHFTVEDSGETFTGDSIGLAIALLTYTQLLQLELERQDRFLSAEVAYTGAVSPEGEILPVSDESIGAKVKRVFHSPVRFLVLPQANYPAARSALDELGAAYPRRSLTLIPVRHLADCLNDHNVVRSQKVCIGEYVARRAAKYSRMTKVQVPLLVVLGYLMLAIIDPRAFWLFFDRNPAFVLPDLESGSIVAFNADSTQLWSHKFSASFTSPESDTAGIVKHMRAIDINGDGDNEVLVIPPNQDDVEENSWLYYFNRRGKIMFKRYLSIPNQYPGDTDSTVYHNFALYPVRFADTMYIITIATQVSPARTHIRLWSNQGDSIWWFINAGGADLKAMKDLDGDGSDELIFSGYNNRLGCAAFFALNRYTESGASPPFTDIDYPLSRVRRARTYAYLTIPPSDVCSVEGRTNYNHPGHIATRDRLGSAFDVYTSETAGGGDEIIYTLNERMRVIAVLCTDQFLRTRRRLVEQGILSVFDDSTYHENLRKSVLYWFPDGWKAESELERTDLSL